MPGSVDGLIRSMRPGSGARRSRRRRARPACRAVSSGTSIAGTIACNSISFRSTTVTSGASNATFSPGCTWRLATMPDSGATTIRVAQRILRELHLRFRRLHAAARDVERRLGAVERVLRDELCRSEAARSSRASSRRAPAAPARSPAAPMRSTSLDSGRRCRSARASARRARFAFAHGQARRRRRRPWP